MYNKKNYNEIAEFSKKINEECITSYLIIHLLGYFILLINIITIYFIIIKY
jgi:hypothetical protein